MGRQVLLIGRVGEQSMHRHWIANASGERRVFDLHLSYYGAEASPFPDRGPDVTLTHDPGAKFPGLSVCLDKLDKRLPSYKWICFVDDDIWATYGVWEKFFAVVEQLQPNLAQPALKRGSFYSHDITLERPAYMARWTNFVEIMNFCFSRDFLSRMRPSFKTNESGWGLDYYWAQHAAPAERSLAIVDSAPVLHTRAVGRGGLYAVMAGGVSAAREDRVALAAVKPRPKAFAGVRHDGTIDTHAALNRPLYLQNRISKLRKLLRIYSVQPPAG